MSELDPREVRILRLERALALTREELTSSREELLGELGWTEPWGPVAVIGRLRHLLRRCATQELDPELAALVEAALSAPGPYGEVLELEAEVQLGTLQLGTAPSPASEDDA